MQSALSGKPSKAGGIIVIDGDLSAGFELPFQRMAVITDSELFKGTSETESTSAKDDECRTYQKLLGNQTR